MNFETPWSHTKKKHAYSNIKFGWEFVCGLSSKREQTYLSLENDI